MGKLPLPVLKELEQQARQSISTLNFATTFAKTSSCNSTLEKYQHSLKSTFKRSNLKKKVPTLKRIRGKRGFEEACEYLDLWDKTFIIQHRALTCLSKSLAHIPQRELYSMRNTSLLRHEAEMTLLQPQLGEMRHQECIRFDQALADCIQCLLSKNAIERVENVKSLGFYSHLFLVPRPHHRWKPVIGLSRLTKLKLQSPSGPLWFQGNGYH